jgi:hypothetical protein
MHGALQRSFAYEKIVLSVSVGSVPNAAWYKTDIFLRAPDRGSSR